MKKDLENSISNEQKEFETHNHFWKSWMKIVGVMALLVFAGVNILLRINGQALNHSKLILSCEYEVHTHTEECYRLDENGERILICGKADYVVHTHNEFCYDEDGNLVCEFPVIPGHVHDDSCYEERKVLICGYEDEVASSQDSNAGEIVLLAETGNGEVEVPVESDFEIDNQESAGEAADSGEGNSESEQPLNEGDASTESTEEGLEESTKHVHTDACYRVEKVLICGRDEMHEHTENCYGVDESGNKVLICGELEVVAHIHDASCQKLVDLTEEEIAALNEETLLEEPEETEEVLEEYVKEYRDSKYVVTVSYTDAAHIPEDAELRVEEITTDDSQYEDIENQSLELIDDESTSVFASLDIGFYVDGEEIEPEAEVNVTVQFLDVAFEEDEEMTIIHIEDAGSSIVDTTTVDEEGQVSFTAESFSIYTFSKTTNKIKKLDEGIYSNYFVYSRNMQENAFLSDEYAPYRVDNGCIGEVASSFHIVAFDTVYITVHTNGNILAKNAKISQSNWGTHSKNYAIRELSYIQNADYVGTIPDEGMGTGEDGNPAYRVLAIGSGVSVESDAAKSYLKVGSEAIAANQAAKYIVQDGDTDAAPFINLEQVKKEVEGISQSLASYDTNTNVKAYISASRNDVIVSSNQNDKNVDGNDRYICITDPDAAAYYNITASDLNALSGNQLRLIGFETTDGSSDITKAKMGSLIINVDCSDLPDNNLYISMPQQSPVYFNATIGENGKIEKSGTQAPTGEVVEFSGGKVIWNFYNAKKGTQIYAQQVTGIILAPNADVFVNMMNGNVVGNNVTITGESHRTDFTGTTIPFTAELVASKTVDGFAPSQNASFSFTLEEWNGSSWETIETVTNNGKDVVFTNQTYDKEGVFWYKMSEVTGDDPNYQYDPSVYVIRVDVTKNNTKLEATYQKWKIANNPTITIKNNTIYCDNKKASTDKITFVNDVTFENSACTSITVVKEWLGVEISKDLPSITVQLYQTKDPANTDPSKKQGTAYGNPVVISAAEYKDSTGKTTYKWEYTWESLPKVDADGNSVYYYILETGIPEGYEQIADPVFMQDGTYTLKNQKKPDYLSISVSKKFYYNGQEVCNPIVDGDTNAFVKFRLYFRTTTSESNYTKWSGWSTSAFSSTIYPGAIYNEKSGTYTLSASNNWACRIEGLPKTTVDQNGVITKYEYTILESESNLTMFPFKYDLKGGYDGRVILYGEPAEIETIDGDQSGNSYTFVMKNYASEGETTQIEADKTWLTYSGNEDSIQLGQNGDVTIKLAMTRAEENGANQTDIGYFDWYAYWLQQVTSSGQPIANTYQFETPKAWSLVIKELPKYYVKSDGSFGIYVYGLREVTDANNYGYGQYELIDTTVTSENGILGYHFTNQSRETYELPATGGSGTVLYWAEKWWKKIFKE